MKFVVPGQPQPQSRPRFFRRGDFVGAYDAEPSKNFKNLVALSAKQSGVFLINGAVGLSIVVYLKRPLKIPNSARNTGIVPHTKRGDCDNFAKSVMDGLANIGYNDDGQICELCVKKFYHEEGGVPRTEVEIYEIA